MTELTRADQLVEKWSGPAIRDNSLRLLKPSKFLVLIAHQWSYGHCSSWGETTLVYDDLLDALGAYRHYHLPRILDADSGIRSPEDVWLPAEAYLDQYEADFAADLRRLLARLDEMIRENPTDPEVLETFRNELNEVFEQTNPSHQILAWGVLSDFLYAPCIEEVLAEPESDEEEEAFSELQDLMDNNTLNPGQPKHWKLIKRVLERLDGR